MARNPRDLCTLEELKARLTSYQEPADAETRAQADALLSDIIGAVSERIMSTCGRELVSNLDTGTTGNDDWPLPPVETRTFTLDINPAIPGGGRAAFVKVGDMREAPTAILLGARWTSSTWALDMAANPPLYYAEPEPRKPWMPIRRLRLLGGLREAWSVTVTSRWGFPEVPRDLRLAARNEAAIWAKIDLQRYSDTFGRNVVDQTGGPPREPRALSAATYDTCMLYHIPEVA